MKILITGANGFVGTTLSNILATSETAVLGTVRSEAKASKLPDGVEPIVVPSLEDLSPLDRSARGVDCVVHLAARVHQLKDKAANPLLEFRRANVEVTANLANWAACSDVKRFVFLSSIKVHGEGQDLSEAPRVYRESDTPDPRDPYGVSKWEAELALRDIAQKTGIEIVILRPTLIYGPDVKANFLQLMRFVDAGLPLPLSRVNNARSLLYLGNLVDAIRLCMRHEKASGETFLIGDGEDLSTPELIRRLASSLDRTCRMFPVSPTWLERLGRVSGKSMAVRRLLGSLRIDISKIRQKLDWSPPFSVNQGLRATAVWYRKQRDQPQPTKRAA